MNAATLGNLIVDDLMDRADRPRQYARMAQRITDMHRISSPQVKQLNAELWTSLEAPKHKLAATTFTSISVTAEQNP